MISAVVDMQAAADACGAAVKIIKQTELVSLMLTFTEGNLLEADAEALVNTVNTVGVMGKGIALCSKRRSPKTSRHMNVLQESSALG